LDSVATGEEVGIARQGKPAVRLIKTITEAVKPSDCRELRMPRFQRYRRRIQSCNGRASIRLTHSS